MRATSIIFRREFGAYVRSPIGWVLVAAVLLVSGVLFQSYAMAGELLSGVVMERHLWLSSGVVMVAGIAVSVRLIAEERQAHSLVLLTTSPISDMEIVMGKFLAGLAFLGVMLGLSLYIPLLIKVNGKIAGAQILVGYLGLLLLGGASIAIGMFASALTKQMLVAALIGAAMLTLMVMLFPLAKGLSGTVKDVMSELDLWWVHFQTAFMRGVFTLKDTVYYLAVIYFFLLLTAKTLEAKRWQ